MPELAEVEYYRKCWNAGLGETIQRVRLRGEKRIFRGTPVTELVRRLTGATFQMSEARGKQMLFRFSGDLCLGIHLGMTGKLRVERAHFKPEKHDHLALEQKQRTLVFSDPRLFGRVYFHHGTEPPKWWAKLPPSLDSREFTLAAMSHFVERHRRLAIKATLLLQDGFPGIGNWMADEILWRSRIAPRRLSGRLDEAELRRLWFEVRGVCRGAMKHVSHDFSDPPRGWLFHQRWKREGFCPRDGTELTRSVVGGRTTVWCSKCQPD